LRGSDARSGTQFSYVDLESRAPAQHPLRTFREIVNDVLVSLDSELYEGMRLQSIAPESMLRAVLLRSRAPITSSSGGHPPASR
jgi:transposase